VKPKFEISDEQQLMVGLLLALLIAISLLYCLGLASLALRQAWQEMPLPWNEEGTPGGELGLTPTPAPERSATPSSSSGDLFFVRASARVSRRIQESPADSLFASLARAVPPRAHFDRTWLQSYNRLVAVISQQGERGRFSWTSSPC
jgi:hypothetical protein